MSIVELEDVAFGLVLALMTIGIATLFGLWLTGDMQRNRRRGRGTTKGPRRRG